MRESAAWRADGRPEQGILITPHDDGARRAVQRNGETCGSEYVKVEGKASRMAAQMLPEAPEGDGQVRAK